MNSKKNRNRYTDEFKGEALRLAENRGSRTINEIAKDLGVSAGLLHTWKKRFDPQRENDRGETPEQELARLRRENAQLRRDREALVKSIAVVVRGDRK